MFEKSDPRKRLASHALLLTKNGNVLLQKKSNDAPLHPGKISLFGGGIEEWEDVEVALRRELFEELGIDLTNYRYEKLNEYLKTVEFDGHDALLYVYLIFDVDPINLVLNEGEAIIEDTVNNVVKNPNITRITSLVLQDYLKLR
jgi:8-oxo-dGTP pyrophosphatase MutT (NUDIX family)